MWPYKEARKEPVHATSELPPSVHDWDKPVWPSEIATLSELHQDVALELSGHILRSTKVPTIVILSGKELSIQLAKHDSDFGWRWTTIADRNQFRINTRWVYDPATDEPCDVIGGDWALANNGVGDDNLKIQHDS